MESQIPWLLLNLFLKLICIRDLMEEKMGFRILNYLLGVSSCSGLRLSGQMLEVQDSSKSVASFRMNLEKTA